MSGINFVRTIMPKERPLIDLDVLNALTRQTYRSYATLTKELLRKPTRTWHEKPSFGAVYITTKLDLRLRVYAYGAGADKYLWLDEGVKGRIIVARRTRFLSFRYKYRAATVPGTLSSRTAQRLPPSVRTPAVNWLGIRARHFSITVAKMVRQPFSRDMKINIREAIRASQNSKPMSE